MRWFYYSVSLLATLAACVLWLFVLSETGARSVPAPSAAPAFASPGLSVAPVLHPLDDVLTACSIARGCCWRGFRVRPVIGADGAVEYRKVQAATGFVRC